MSDLLTDEPAGETPRDRWPILAALSICYAAAAASAYVLPIVAGSFAEALDFHVEDIGYILSAELLAIMIGAFALFPRLDPGKIRQFMSLSLAAIVMANVFSARTANPDYFIALRGLAGLAEGVVQAGILAMGARLNRPEHGFTIIYTILTLVLAAIFLGTPEMVARWGYGSALLVLAGMAVSALFVVQALPVGRREQGAAPEVQASFKTTARILVAWAAFIAGQYALFVYAERIAHDIGVSFEQTGLIFALASLITIPAPWVAGWSIGRFGLAVPVALATLLSAGAIVAFPFTAGAASYGVVFLLFNCAVFFAFPLFSTLGARVDQTGRVPSLLPAAQAFAMVVGPIVASAALGLAHSYLILALVACAVSLLALLAFFPARESDRAAKRV